MRKDVISSCINYNITLSQVQQPLVHVWPTSSLSVSMSPQSAMLSDNYKYGHCPMVTANISDRHHQLHVYTNLSSPDLAHVTWRLNINAKNVMFISSATCLSKQIAEPCLAESYHISILHLRWSSEAIHKPRQSRVYHNAFIINVRANGEVWVWISNHPTLYTGCNCLFILELKLIHVSKRGTWMLQRLNSMHAFVVDWAVLYKTRYKGLGRFVS